MATVGYHASHEQAPPDLLLRATRLAEQGGFAAASCSDHLLPWSARQRGGVAFAWSWLGAALATTTLPFGVVTAPGQRYHPTLVAQAATTLTKLFPGRFWLAAGSGENLNEHVTGDPWPEKSVRNARLERSVAMMRALWAGETVSSGPPVRADRARVYTSGAEPPPVYAAALTPETARWAAGWADGLITISQPHDELRRLVEAFREGGGERKPLLVQVKLSWAESDEAALALAYDQWRTNVFSDVLALDLALPEQFDEAARHVRPEDLHAHVLSSADAARHAQALRDLAELGFDELYLHNVGTNQLEFVDAFGEHVLPALRP